MSVALLGPVQSIARARQFTRYRTGQCLNYVANVLTNGKMLGVYAPYALHAWANAHWKHTDRTPPPGVPVWFNHGPNDVYGHICLSLGGGRIRTTNWGPIVNGYAPVGETTIAELEKRWGRAYVGWAEDLYGNRIPGFPRVAPRVLMPYPGHVHSDKAKDDSHVGLIQKALAARGYYHGAIDNHFGPATAQAVYNFQTAQKITRDRVVGPVTWSRLRIYK